MCCQLYMLLTNMFGSLIEFTELIINKFSKYQSVTNRNTNQSIVSCSIQFSSTHVRFTSTTEVIQTRMFLKKEHYSAIISLAMSIWSWITISTSASVVKGLAITTRIHTTIWSCAWLKMVVREVKVLPRCFCKF
jgi:hypothetical protein